MIDKKLIVDAKYLSSSSRFARVHGEGTRLGHPSVTWLIGDCLGESRRLARRARVERWIDSHQPPAETAVSDV